MGGWQGILTLVLVREAFALARRWGLTASAIAPAAAPSRFVYVKPLHLPQPAWYRTHHMTGAPPLPGKGRQLGASTGCNVGQSTLRGLSLEDGGPAPFAQPRPWPEHWPSRPRPACRFPEVVPVTAAALGRQVTSLSPVRLSRTQSGTRLRTPHLPFP